MNLMDYSSKHIFSLENDSYFTKYYGLRKYSKRNDRKDYSLEDKTVHRMKSYPFEDYNCGVDLSCFIVNFDLENGSIDHDYHCVIVANLSLTLLNAFIRGSINDSSDSITIILENRHSNSFYC